MEAGRGFLVVFLFLFGGNTRQSSGVTPSSALGNHSWQVRGTILIPGIECGLASCKEMLLLLYSHSDPHSAALVRSKDPVSEPLTHPLKGGRKLGNTISQHPEQVPAAH